MFNGHCHTEYSNITAGLDSINRLDSLVKRALELGLKGIAITDHDNLCAAIDVNKKQKELRRDGVDFVLAQGNEIYLIDEFFEKQRQKYYHFILIAKDRIGYEAIRKLSSQAWYQSEVCFGRRRVYTLKRDLEEILKTAKGHIIGSTACIGGEIASLINSGDFPKADKFLEWCANIFGIDDFYIELQPNKIKDQINFNTKVLQLYPEYQFTITTDAHYQDAEDFPIFEAFLRSQQESREVKEYYDHARLQSEKEVRELLSYLPTPKVNEALKNTLRIAKQIEFYDLSETPRIPNVPIPEFEVYKFDNPQYPEVSQILKSENIPGKFLLSKCLRKLEELGKIDNKEYLSRLELETSDSIKISEKINDNIFNYFTTIYFLQETAWKINCAVGISRGSAAGSLLLYLSDVVQMDPIEHELYWWRFMSPERPELPKNTLGRINSVNLSRVSALCWLTVSAE